MSRRVSGSMVALSGLLVWMFTAGMPVASADAALDQCRAQFTLLHDETRKLYQRVLTTSGITQNDRRELMEFDRRLSFLSELFHRQPNMDGKGPQPSPLNNCRALTQQLIRVRDELVRMASRGADRERIKAR